MVFAISRSAAYLLPVCELRSFILGALEPHSHCAGSRGHVAGLIGQAAPSPNKTPVNAILMIRHPLGICTLFLRRPASSLAGSAAGGLWRYVICYLSLSRMFLSRPCQQGSRNMSGRSRLPAGSDWSQPLR